MAFPTDADVLTALRLAPDSFKDGELNGLVNDALGHLREASGTADDQTPPETATGREFVTEYATGHALKRSFLGGSGTVDTDEAAKLLARADKLLDKYDAAHTSPREQTAETPVAFVSYVPW